MAHLFRPLASLLPQWEAQTDPLSLQALRGPVVILGGGVAGLFCALKLAPLPTVVVSVTPIGEGASSWAQGGVAAAVAEGDTVAAHRQDTIAAGAGLVDPLIAELIAQEACARVEDLRAYGVPFDQDAQGKFLLSREAAHSTRRVVRVQGDRAGRAIMAALITQIHASPSIQLYPYLRGQKLLVQNGRVRGIELLSEEGTILRFLTEAVVLATGGLGHLYATTTNPAQADGQGLGLAARAGAAVADAEFVQFHPTALDLGRDPAPLATEALRGEGGILLREDGTRLMAAHPAGDLAPRDQVTRAIFAENKQGGSVFLDCVQALGPSFEEKFPTVFQICCAAGRDPTRESFPVRPAAHYHMGGIATDAWGRSSLPGLWACGEVACTGAHGANRLASNSLLESVVFAQRVAEDIRGRLTQEAPRGPLAQEKFSPLHSTPSFALSEEIQELRALMETHVGVQRDREGLREALQRLKESERRLRAQKILDQAALNRLISMQFITVAALQRAESRGSHFRSDIPSPSLEWQRHSFLYWSDLLRFRFCEQKGTAHVQRP